MRRVVYKGVRTQQSASTPHLVKKLDRYLGKDKSPKICGRCSLCNTHPVSKARCKRKGAHKSRAASRRVACEGV